MDDSATSAEAVRKFKSQISKCLPLLGFLSNTGKEDVWRFWKTISAAVKIALNGKGNIIQTPKRQRKVSVRDMDSELEQKRLQELDQKAISIYVPLKSSKDGMMKYRILKFANQTKIADYFEEVHCVDSEEKKVMRVANVEDVRSDNDDDENSENADACVKSLQPSILNLISAGEKDDSTDGLKSVANFLKGFSSKPVTQSASEREICSGEPNSLLALNDSRPQGSTKKIWPIGRPTTRSAAGAKSYSALKAVKSKLISCEIPSNGKFSYASPQKEMDKDRVVLQHDIYGSQRNFENSKNNIQSVSAANPILQVQQENIDTKLENSSQNVTGDKRSEMVSTDTVSHIVSSELPAYEIQMNNELQSSGEGTVDSSVNEPLNKTATSSSSGHQQTQSRNASDIETIISALEEELKKSSPNVTGISANAQANQRPTSTPTNQVNSHSPTSNTPEKRKRSQALSDMDISEAQIISTTDMNDIQAPYLKLQTSVDQQARLTNTFGLSDNIEAAEQHLNVTSNQGTTDAEETVQTVNLHDGPIRVAAYLDEMGRPIHTETGQVTTLVNESGQPVQILHDQEIVEVEGSIDNIIWACDGEVQIMQQLQQQEEYVQNQEVVSEHQEMDTNEGSAESQPVQAHYDVVEYEVLSDKRLKRGRKRKAKNDSRQAGEEEDSNGNSNSELLERTCPICHRVLNYASSMKAHMRIHTGARPYSCGQCDRTFTTKANRDRHEATHVGLKPFKCTECHKSFTEKRSLKIHMRSHTGERPYVCETCGQGFAQNCTLQVHKALHTDRRAHLCDLCGKAFRQKNQLEVHVKRHKRQAAYPCMHCETRCYTKGDLMRHMVKHTGERPYRCQLCPRAFTRKQYLVDHENQHYNRKPYRCSECGICFHDMGSFHRHLRKHKSAKDETKQVTAKLSHKLPILNTDVVHKMLGTAKPGQMLKLEDNSDAVVKEVTSDSDGSTVYHITFLNIANNSTATTSLSCNQQQSTQDIQPQSSHEVTEADLVTLSQDAIIKIEDTDNFSEDHTRFDSTHELRETEVSVTPKVENIAGNCEDFVKS
ncbi:hypothetical protein RRG08_018655 [Elysia crispata]|uniref:C2H2-type domain-containing protein n=1 Tax=Elysia crispata TaxID=231223 RepID=A0AAE0XYG1_9GAST|nr:hypothetical protein RRG08_018655 [Elysia crispata]